MKLCNREGMQNTLRFFRVLQKQFSMVMYRVKSFLDSTSISTYVLGTAIYNVKGI